MTTRSAASLLVASLALALSPGCVQYEPLASSYPPPPPPIATAPDNAPAPPVQAPAEPGPYSPGPEQGAALDALVGPIALYPDPLVALVLPASADPSDLTAAAAYLVQYGDPSQIDRQPWDPSVRALAHYPAVVAWMANNLPWTQALGSAFSASPGSVMTAIQRMRSRALATGSLVSTPQQRVAVVGGEIEILPAQSDAIYVPAYDPAVVYAGDAAAAYGPPVDFGPPFAVGAWFVYGLDWSGQTLWLGGPGAWRSGPSWRAPGERPSSARPWRAPNGKPTGASNPSGQPAPAPRPFRSIPEVRTVAPQSSAPSKPQPRPRLVLPATQAPLQQPRDRPAPPSPNLPPPSPRGTGVPEPRTAAPSSPSAQPATPRAVPARPAPAEHASPASKAAPPAAAAPAPAREPAK